MPTLRTPLAALALLASLVPGCHDADEAPRPWEDRVRADAQLDDRDQYALLDAIVAAKGNQLFSDPGVLPRVRSEWIDRRFRWEVRLQPALCGPTSDCVVLPFDHARRSEPITQGWLPRLELDPTARAALVERCSTHEQCVITFEGTLKQFELSTELPTSLTFGDVEVVADRDARPDESWTISRRRERLHERARAAIAAMDRRQAERARD